MDPGIDAQAGNVPGEPPSRVFDVVLRGYDRHQVDEHIEQLEDQARQHGDQAQALQRELFAVQRQLRERERPTHAGRGLRIEQLLRLAEEQATEILGEARTAVDELQAAAKVDAAELRAAAENEAAELRASAKRETDDLRASAEPEADAVKATARREADELTSTTEREVAKVRATADHQVAEKRAAAELLRNRIHAVLADHGHGRPEGCWSGPGRAWIASLDLPAVSAEVIQDALALIDALESVTGRLDAEIRGHARSDPRVNVLTQLPGVGPFTALVLLAEIGDITRFASARKLASWAGLTPTVRGSDRTVRHGHISKQGSVWVRWILCEAAQKAKRHPDFAASYQAIAGRRGTKIATTAIARKLLTRAYHLLTDASSASAPS